MFKVMIRQEDCNWNEEQSNYRRSEKNETFTEEFSKWIFRAKRIKKNQVE